MKFVLLLLILAGLLTSKSAFAAEKIPGTWTTNSADREACQRQLNIIYSAIQAYQKKKQELPEWLSDLVPKFIHNPNFLTCPFVVHTGNLRKYRKEYMSPVFSDPAACSYAYEFCTVPIPHVKKPLTCRTYKERQMELIGFGVPIVRCFAHRPILNVGFDGNIYASPGEWEDNFASTDEVAVLLHGFPTTGTQNELVRKVLQKQTPSTNASFIDLFQHYNALLLHLSQLDHSGKTLATYPEGLQTIAGVEFDVRALVHLSARDFPITFPDKATGIPVKRKSRNIHFLHGTMFDAPDGVKTASFIVHYHDGRSEEIAVLYGKDVKTRWFDRARESEDGAAWVSPRDQVGTTGRSLRLYVTSWTNSDPNVEIKSIDFVSHLTESAPFLAAITVD